MRPDIDNPHTRHELARQTTVERIGSIPLTMFEKTWVVLGNYIGYEEGPDGNPYLIPTMNGLVYLTDCVSGPKGKNRLMAVARKGFVDLLPESFKILSGAIIKAEKKGNDYEVVGLDRWTMGRHLSRSGVLWMAPGATTEKDGLIFDLRTGGIRIAMAKGYSLAALAMETEGTGLNRSVTALHMAEIPLPTVKCEIKGKEGISLLREANYAIGLYTLAVTASLLPDDHERGEYTDPQGVMERAQYILRGMQREGLTISGGFLNDP